MEHISSPLPTNTAHFVTPEIADPQGVPQTADPSSFVQTGSSARRRLETDFAPTFGPMSNGRHSSVVASPMSKFFVKHAVETIITPSMSYFANMVNTATWLYDVNGLGDPSNGDFTVCANTAWLKGKNFTTLQNFLQPYRNSCSESQWHQVVLAILQSYHSSLRECIQTLGLVPTLKVDEPPQVWLNDVTKRVSTAKWVCSFNFGDPEVVAAQARIDDLTYYSLSERIPPAWKPHLRLRYTSPTDRTLNNLVTWLTAAHDLTRQGVSPTAMPVQVAPAPNAVAPTAVSKLRADLLSEFRSSIGGLRDNVMALRVMDLPSDSRKRHRSDRTHRSIRDRSPNRDRRSGRDRSPDRTHRSTRDRSPDRYRRSDRDRTNTSRSDNNRSSNRPSDPRASGDSLSHRNPGGRGTKGTPRLTDSTLCRTCAKEGLNHTYVNCPRYKGCTNCTAMGHCATSPICPRNLNFTPGK